MLLRDPIFFGYLHTFNSRLTHLADLASVTRRQAHVRTPRDHTSVVLVTAPKKIVEAIIPSIFIPMTATWFACRRWSSECQQDKPVDFFINTRVGREPHRIILIALPAAQHWLQNMRCHSVPNSPERGHLVAGESCDYFPLLTSRLHRFVRFRFRMLQEDLA